MDKQREASIDLFRQILHEKVQEGARRWKSIVEEVGLTVGQTGVLTTLAAHNGKCSMRELSELSHQPGAVLTGIIDRLLKMELVARQADMQDRRVVLVLLTPLGQARLAQLEATDRKAITEDLSSFSDEEVQLFSFLLHKFSQSIRQALDSNDEQQNKRKTDEKSSEQP